MAGATDRTWPIWCIGSRPPIMSEAAIRTDLANLPISRSMH